MIRFTMPNGATANVNSETGVVTSASTEHAKLLVEVSMTHVDMLDPVWFGGHPDPIAEWAMRASVEADATLDFTQHDPLLTPADDEGVIY